MSLYKLRESRVQFCAPSPRNQYVTVKREFSRVNQRLLRDEMTEAKSASDTSDHRNRNAVLELCSVGTTLPLHSLN